MTSKSWNVFVLICTLFVLSVLGGITVYIDPLFHYHAPLEQYEYTINDERYQNDGILRNFDYNTIIIGTSMVENFKASECDQLFSKEYDVTTVKVPLQGAPYKEVNENLSRAFKANYDIKKIIRCLDYTSFFQDKDAVWHGVVDYGAICAGQRSLMRFSTAARR